jgi:hypothetical protein
LHEAGFFYAARVAIPNVGVQRDAEKNGSDEDGISNNAQEQSSLIARIVALADRRCAAPVLSSR